ncbi:MAG: heat-inducible transcriptional repressor HrcA [Defluviitaleaceae bacterium]|nr:heat-inducible transcriptional repressor HrcA [Defluviitaleaceae bacterium]
MPNNDKDFRKFKILDAIITEYISTGEPVSSRALEKKHNLGISSATIRNEMSDLEEMGLIVQPHTSSGRIPSDKGYRIHVDSMKGKNLNYEQIEYLKNIIVQNVGQTEHLMKETAKAIAALTNYTTIVSEAPINLSIHYIQLIPMDSYEIVLVVITVTKLVKNAKIKVEKEYGIETLNMWTSNLNSILKGKTAEEIEAIKLETSEPVLEEILQTIAFILKKETQKDFLVAGVNNILAHPEFSDISKAQNLFKTLEEKDRIISLLNKEGSESIEIVIGEELEIEELKDCSIIKANYMIGEGQIGQLGIVGPKRMDYAEAVAILNTTLEVINEKRK